MFFTESTGFQESGKYDYIVIDEHTDLTQLAEDSILESEEYTARLMEGIGRFELAKISEGVAPAEIYTEGMVGAIWEKIKKIFKFAKEWVKVIFRKFMAWVNSIIKSDADFATKYKKDIEKGFGLVDGDKEIGIKLNPSMAKDLGSVGSKMSEYQKNAFNKMDQYIGTDANGKPTNNTEDGKTTDLNKDELEKFRDGLDDMLEDFKDAIYDNDVMKVRDYGSASTIIEILKSKTTEITKTEKNVTRDLDNIQKQISKYTNPLPNIIAGINAGIGFMKKLITELLKVMRLLKSAARKAARICISAANKGPKWSEYRESAFDRTELNDYLRNV